MDAPSGPFPRLRRHLRRGCDEGSASIASYVVAASVFVIGSSYLFHFVIEPPGASTVGLEHETLRVTAQTALQVLLGTTGHPAAWETNAPGIQRLGLIEEGTSIRIDPAKFDALARGRFATATTDDRIDYAEAKQALGIEGYDFHLRAYPSAGTNDTAAYGLDGMEDFRVAYVGHWAGGSETLSSKNERWALEVLNIGFTNTTRSSGPAGDVFQDSSSDIRANLLPVIGPTLHQTVISEGAGTKFDFYRVDASRYDGIADPDTDPLAPGPPLTSAMALSSDGATLGYTKNRELRAIMGVMNLSAGGGAGDLTWREYVDTGHNNATYDCGDYGFVEVSYNNGTTWTRLTDTAADRSQDCDVLPETPHGTELDARSVSFDCDCHDVLLAFHWVADNDNNDGYGWIVDDVRVVSGGAIVLSETFSAPEYDMVILGSDVDHQSFTPDDVKDGIRDYVDRYGGRLIVLGGQNNVNWLDRLLTVGTGGASGGLASPDTTHPLLTLPNQLDHAGYRADYTWNFTSAQANLFSMVMGESTLRQNLTVSRAGTWSSGGSVDGAVILTSFKPYEWDYTQTRSFFANAAVYGKYHYLFLEVGPPVPSGEMVATASRTATMNKYRTGEANYTEMTFVMYLWPGSSSAGTLAQSALTPTAPRSVSVASTSGQAWINWTAPISNGTTLANGAEYLTHFDVWRGNGPTTFASSPLVTIPVSNATWASTFSYHDTTTVDGTTYYYNVTASTATGRGTPSAIVSTTPAAFAAAPGSFAADTSTPGVVRLTWTNPGTAATGTILGYRINASTALGGPYATIAEVGNVTTHDHVPGDTTPRYFKIEALNSRGYGASSNAVGPAAAAEPTPISGPTLTVASSLNATNLSLVWVAPDLLGQTLDSWRIWRSTQENAGYALVANVTDPAASTYEDSGLAPGSVYWYKVQGLTNVGMGQNSTAKSAVPVGLSSAPTAFTANAGVLGGTVALAWGPPANLSYGNLTGYVLWRSTDATTYTLVTSDLTQTNVSFLDSGLGPNATRYYRVQARTETGAGLAANASATTLPPAGVPTDFAVSNATSGSLSLSWVAPTALGGGTLTGYRIWRSLDNATWTLLDSPGALNTSFVDAGLGANATRHYRIQAMTDVGPGMNTSAVSNRTNAVPYPPTGVDAADSLGTTTVSWSAPYSDAAITQYEICRATSQGGQCDTWATSVASPYVAVESNANKWFKVRAYSAAGWGEWSAADQA